MSTLFSLRHVSDLITQREDRVIEEIRRLTEDQLRNTESDVLGEGLAKRHSIQFPILGGREEVEMDAPVFEMEGMLTIKFHMTFNGDPDVFLCYNRSRSQHNFPIYVSDGNHVTFVLQATVTGSDWLDAKVDDVVARVRDDLDQLKQHIDNFNANLKAYAVDHIKHRQETISKRDAFSGRLQEVFKLRRRDDGSEKVIIPQQQTVIRLTPKAVGTKPADPELSLGDYDQVLDVILSMVKVFGRSPSVFKEMDEEHLRTILLVALNGVFKGDATGETFNGKGKTDILIRHENENVFLAECLVWDGPDYFRKKLTEQLFNYATWHDTKLAAIVFNRNKGFTSVVTKMKEVVKGLGNKVEEMDYAFQDGCRVKLKREDDPDKHFILTCLAFEVPS